MSALVITYVGLSFTDRGVGNMLTDESVNAIVTLLARNLDITIEVDGTVFARKSYAILRTSIGNQITEKGEGLLWNALRSGTFLELSLPLIDSNS
jgi:hypothetical protein